MAIETIPVGTGTTVYTSTGETAITLMSLCNYGIVTETVSIYIVKNGDTFSNDNLFISNMNIIPDDTFIVYQGGEKIILENGDTIYVVSTNPGVITAITSYLAV